MPAVGGGGRGNAGKATPAAKKKAAPKKTYMPKGRSDAAQQEGAKPVKQRTTHDKPGKAAPYLNSRSDAAQSGGAHGRKRAAAWRKSPAGIAEKFVNAPPAEQAKMRANAKGVERRTISAVERYFADRGREGDRPFTDAERAGVDAFKATPTYLDALARTKAEREVRDNPDLPDYATETDPAKLAAMGFKPEGFLDKGMKLPAGILSSGAAVAEGVYHDPIGVPLKTAGQAALAIPASLAGAVELVRHPIRTTEEGVASFVDRVDDPYAKKRERVREEGAFTDAADVAAAFLPASVGARQLALRAGHTTPRPDERVSGGTVRPQRDSAGMISGAARAAGDKRRGRKLAERLTEAEAGGRPISVIEYQAAVRNREAGDEVELPARRTEKQFRNPARIQVARERGRAVYGLRADQGRRTKAAQKAIDRLDPNEKRAFYFAAALGIRTAAQARELLPGIAEAIKAERAAKGVQIVGALKKTDMLPKIAAILRDPDAHFTPRLAETVDGLEPDSRRAAAEDPRLAPEQAETRRHADQAAVLGLDASDLAAVRAAAADLELAEPQYFRSSRYADERGYGAYAVGGGHGAMRPDRAHTGANLALGLVDTSPRQYVQGLARNVKAKHNWSMIAGIVDQNAIPELSPPQGATIVQLRTRIAEAGIDPESVAFFDAGAFRASAQHSTGVVHDDRFEDAESFEGEQIADALNGASVYPGSAISPEVLQSTRRWVAVPTAVLRELEAETAPSGFAGRAWDVTKGKMSRAMLLTSPPWLVINVASNALLTALGTGGRSLNPKNMIDAQRWWRGLDDAERDRVGAILGMDATSADSHQIRMGATTNSDFANAYKALKEHPFWSTGLFRGRGPSIKDMNLLEAMAKLDRSQNNLFRKQAAYALMKRETFRDMAKNMKLADKAQFKIVAALRFPPTERLHLLAKNRDAIEANAQHVKDYLGDYMTYTAAERKVIMRTAMFGGWLRHSLHLVFGTMPTQHPIMTAMLAQLGQMRVEELRELFGVEGLPWQLGKITWGEDGNVRSIDLTKVNPAGNAIMDAVKSGNPRALLGVTPPFVSMAVDQLTHSTGFRDGGGNAEWRVVGKAAPYGARPIDYGVGIRGRILLDDVASLTFPYRTAEKLKQSGPQGDDSLLFGERRTDYKGGTSAADKAKKKFYAHVEERDEREESLIAELLPLLPASEHEAEDARAAALLRIEARAARGSKPKPKYFGGDGGKPTFYGATR